MTIDGKVASQSFSGDDVAAAGHGPILRTFKLGVVVGALLAGAIMALDALGKLIPHAEATEVFGTGDDTTTDFTGTLTITGPLQPGKVTVSDGAASSPQVLSDDGSGRLYGDGSGTINYATGAISVSFDAAPATGSDPEATFRTDPVAVLDRPVDATKESAVTAYVHGTVKAAALTVGGSAADQASIDRLVDRGIYPI